MAEVKKETFQPGANSFKYREAQADQKKNKPRQKKVVKGNVKKKGDSAIEMFIDSFITTDASSLKEYIFRDMLPQMSKNLIMDTLDTFFRGGSRRGRTNADYVSYDSKYYGSEDRFSSRRDSSRIKFKYEDVIFTTRSDAEHVLDQMANVIEEYGSASVLDLCDLMGVGCDPSDNNIGWERIGTAEVVRDGRGYSLRMPKAVSLK